MAESITVQLPQAGDVLIERSYRAKHVRLSFRPPSNVRIAVPLGISFKVAQKFAKESKTGQFDKGTRILGDKQIVDNVIFNWVWIKIYK